MKLPYLKRKRGLHIRLFYDFGYMFFVSSFIYLAYKVFNSTVGSPERAKLVGYIAETFFFLVLFIRRLKKESIYMSYFLVNNDMIILKSFDGQEINRIYWKDVTIAGIRKNNYMAYSAFCPYEIYFAYEKKAIPSAKDSYKSYKGCITTIFSREKLNAFKEFCPITITDEELVEGIDNEGNMYGKISSTSIVTKMRDRVIILLACVILLVLGFLLGAIINK